MQIYNLWAIFAANSLFKMIGLLSQFYTLFLKALETTRSNEAV